MSKKVNVRTRKDALRQSQERELKLARKGSIDQIEDHFDRSAFSILEEEDGIELDHSKNYVEDYTEDYTEDYDKDHNESHGKKPEASLPKNERVSSQSSTTPIYVLDTNVLIGCIDLLYDPTDEDWHEPIDFQPNLDHAHLVIPEVVLNELNHLKGEASYRGMVARTAVKRLERFFANSGHTINEILELKKPVPTDFYDQVISLLPLHRSFSKNLPYTPAIEDHDGWIAVTALAAKLINDGAKTDGTEDVANILKQSSQKNTVTLLTNDVNLRAKAELYGVRTLGYSFIEPAPFTGLREVIVPYELFSRFVGYEGQSTGISLDEWEDYMPDELPLKANEYISMELRDDEDFPNLYFDDGVSFKNVGRYSAENGRIYPLRFAKCEGVAPQNSGIAAYYDALNDDRIKVITVTGPAGTGKTYSAIMHAIKSMQAGRYSRAVIISSASAKNPLGALPGGFDQKMEPLVSACKDAIRSYLANTPEFRQKRKLLGKFGDTNVASREDREDLGDKRRRVDNRYENNHSHYDYSRYEDEYVSANDFPAPHSKKKKKTFYEVQKNDTKVSEDKKLSYSEQLDKQVNYLFSRYFTSMPYELAQGHSFDDAIIILDEFQRVQIDEADTLITRPGRGSKMIICGDVNQIHNSSLEKRLKNGLAYAKLLFDDEIIAAHINLTESLRSDITRIMTKNRDKIRKLMNQL